MASPFQTRPSQPANRECFSAYVILCNAQDTSASFLDTFVAVRKSRNARGTPTDEEQDLLRAMLAFASAGLDSLAKQLIRDALPKLIQRNSGANDMFKTFVERKLKSSGELNHRLLADVISDENPRTKLISLLVSELTSSSLQSTEEILRTAAHFDIPSNELTINPQTLSEIFVARNQIVHEMDVDFLQTNRNRRPRARQKMLDYTNEIFRVSSSFLAGVDNRVSV